MDLSTTYLGMRLPHPLVVGAGPLGDDLDTVRALEDAGARCSCCARSTRRRSPASRWTTFMHIESYNDSFGRGDQLLARPLTARSGPTSTSSTSAGSRRRCASR